MKRRLKLLPIAVATLLSLPGAAKAETVYQEVVYSGAGCRAENDGILSQGGAIWGVVTTGSPTCVRARTVIQVGMAQLYSDGSWGAFNLQGIEGPEGPAEYYSFPGNRTCGVYYASALRFGYSGTIYRGKATKLC